jgi:hypothetical protein
MVRRTPDVKKVNLGPQINSPFSELQPIISPDGQLLFFTMGAGHPDNIGKDNLQDCYVSLRQPDGTWSAPRNLGSPINTDGNDAISGVSPDGNVLFIKNYAFNRTNGLCFARRVKNGTWRIDSITIQQFTNTNTLSSQCISADGKYIIYSAERSDGYGGLDLYVSTLIDPNTNSYGPPQSLGPVINTAKDDFAPFLASDGQSLYFSSRGLKGYGDADVFVAKRLDDSWVNWTFPKNLGPALNTAKMDAYYSVPASGDVAFFSSLNGQNKLDLFMVTLSPELRPNPVILVTGKVQSRSGRPLEATITYAEMASNQQVTTTVTNQVSGRFAIVLPLGRRFTMRVESDNFLPYTDNLDLVDAALYREVKSTITLDSLAEGSIAVLQNIFFDFNKAELKPDPFLNLTNSTRC